MVKSIHTWDNLAEDLSEMIPLIADFINQNEPYLALPFWPAN